MSSLPELIPVVLCGGSGTRLWPLSRESFPKQFLALTGYQPQTDLREGIQRFVDWYQEHYFTAQMAA